MSLFTGTRYPGQLAGIMGLSCYMSLASTFEAERAPANRSTPVFMAHGAYDPMVPPALGDETHRLLTAANYEVEWHSYTMPHSVCPEEVAHIATWLRPTGPIASRSCASHYGRRSQRATVPRG